jgi:O-antigen/teichoic acid export membrane protein
MKAMNRNSILAVASEYLAKGMAYGVGLLSARMLNTVEFGRLTAALAFAMVVANLVDSGMGQIAAKRIAASKSIDAFLIPDMFTWRFAVVVCACLLTVLLGSLFLPPASYRIALGLTPFCLLMGIVDFAAWTLRGLHRIRAYCAMLLGSRILLLLFSIAALMAVPRIEGMVAAYGAAGLLSCGAALGLLSRDAGIFQMRPLSTAFVRGFLPEVYQYAFIFIASVFMVRIDLMLIAKVCGEADAGLYGCAAFVMDALYLVPMAVYGICLPAFSAARDQPDTLAAMFRGPFFCLVGVSLALALSLPRLALRLFPIFFGARYASSGAYFAVLVWSGVPFYANVLFWALLLIWRDFKTMAISMAVGLMVETAADLLLLQRYGPMAAAWARTVGMTLVCLICAGGVYRLRIFHGTVFFPGPHQRPAPMNVYSASEEN